MLTNMNELLNIALSKKVAIPQFNINNLEWAKYILEQAVADNSAIIIGVSEGAIKYMGGHRVVTDLVKSLINELKVNKSIVLHLDHASSYESCKNAIDAGFTSVMIDASKYSYEDNIKITKTVKEYADSHNVSVEAELGHIGGAEDNVVSQSFLADEKECEMFVQDSKVTALAPALGSTHGLYKGEPNIDFLRMQNISNLVKIPLVLHGGTGLSDDILKKSIICGTTKINFNTELQVAWAKSVRTYLTNNTEVYDPRKIISAGEQALKEVVHNKIVLLGSNTI